MLLWKHIAFFQRAGHLLFRVQSFLKHYKSTKNSKISDMVGSQTHTESKDNLKISEIWGVNRKLKQRKKCFAVGLQIFKIYEFSLLSACVAFDHFWNL